MYMFATTLQGFTLGLADHSHRCPECLRAEPGHSPQPPPADGDPLLPVRSRVDRHGVFGGANLLAASPVGLALLTWGGVLFLGWFGVRSLRSAWRGQGAAWRIPQLMGSRGYWP